MKKYQLSILLVAFATNALAQYDFSSYTIAPTYASQAFTATLTSMRINGDSENIDDTFEGDWERTGTDENFTANRTTGTSAYMQTGNNDSTLTLYIDNAVSGWLCTVGQNSGGLNPNVTVIADEMTDGFTSSYYAIGAGDRTDTDNVGAWSIYGGTYQGDSGGFYAENITGSLIVENASFIGSDTSGSAIGGSGIQVEVGSTSVIISNETGNNAQKVKAGDYTSSSTETQDSNLWGTLVDPEGTTTLDTYAVLSIGGSGISAVSSTITINGGDFYASQNLYGTRRTATYFADYNENRFVAATGGRGAALYGATTIKSGNFYGGDAGNAYVSGIDSIAVATGGEGIYVYGNATISDAYAEAGSSGNARVYDSITLNADATGTYDSSVGSDAYASGGDGVYVSGTANLTDVTAIGSSGSSAISHDTNSLAVASGGNGFSGASTTTITGGNFVGANGGTANSDLGQAEAWGGSGAYATGSLTINGGTFTGGDGGTAKSDEGTAVALAGAGVFADGGALIINGGTFTGGSGGTANGLTQLGNMGILANNANVTINNSVSDTLINGNVVFNNTTAKNLTITGGSITGDIDKYGTGTTTMKVSTNASFNGSFNQHQGDVIVSLTSSEESKFFSNVTITDGNMTFSGAKVELADYAQFNIGGSSNTLAFGTAGAELGEGTSINAGYNNVTAGSLDLGTGSTIGYTFDSLSGVSGGLTVTGALTATNQNAKITAFGISDTPTGSKTIVTAGSLVGISNSNVNDIVDVDFGWLTQVTNLDATANITAYFGYNSLTNTSLSDLGSMLTNIDSVVMAMTNTAFYALNSVGEANGTESFRYTLSQMPDTSETTIQTAQKVNGQIAARGTEFRSMNGFASTKPQFSNSPEGVAGPEVQESGELQGWIRVYGGSGTQDASGNFAEYDITSWGTVIGVDKNFSNLLVGLAGGYARDDIDEGSAYDANINTYYGSVYATYGGESAFIDLALTYGINDTEESNQTLGMNGSFDSSLFSAYLGGGYRFNVGEKVAITPEASILGSYYNQEEYDRSSILGTGTIGEYDTTSILGSIGLNIASQHQIDWLNRGIAFIPEVRAFYIHEFDADPDDFTYILGGTATQFAIRPREENQFRVGFGLDMWSWRWQKTKLELDYDALMSDSYFEQLVSGKVTVQF
jgi:outer membrane autotransporter protein